NPAGHGGAEQPGSAEKGAQREAGRSEPDQDAERHAGRQEHAPAGAARLMMRSGVVGGAVMGAGMVSAGVMVAGMPVTGAPATMSPHDRHSEEAGATEGQREDVGIEHERDGWKLNGRARPRRPQGIKSPRLTRCVALHFALGIGYFSGL